MSAINRFDASVRAMRDYYPAFTLEINATRTIPLAVWKGTVQPIQTAAHFYELLDDINNEKPVCVGDSMVLHNHNCRARHTHRAWMDQVSNPYASYALRVSYTGGQAHPRAYIVNPAIPLNDRPHMFRDGAICAYPPWRDAWLWQCDTVVQFLDQVLIWLIKRTVWDQARVWIGAEMPHNTEFLSMIIKPDQQCWCGSGESFKDCHNRNLELAVAK